MHNFDVETIESIIGYTFKNKELLVRAFTHSSYANEHRHEESYERLEFVGDAALNYVVGLYLYDIFPSFGEGKLSKVRAGTVDRQTIAEVIDDLGLLQYMRTGKGNSNLTQGSSVKVKCDLFEAIVGATIIDNNEDLTEAKKIVFHFLSDKISLNNTDYKSKLLERCAQEGRKAVFTVLEEGTEADGFLIALFIDGQEVARARGHNKKEAERNASRLYLEPR